MAKSCGNESKFKCSSTTAWAGVTKMTSSLSSLYCPRNTAMLPPEHEVIGVSAIPSLISCHSMNFSILTESARSIFWGRDGYARNSICLITTSFDVLMKAWVPANSSWVESTDCQDSLKSSCIRASTRELKIWAQSDLWHLSWCLPMFHENSPYFTKQTVEATERLYFVVYRAKPSVQVSTELWLEEPNFPRKLFKFSVGQLQWQRLWFLCIRGINWNIGVPDGYVTHECRKSELISDTCKKAGFSIQE